MTDVASWQGLSLVRPDLIIGPDEETLKSGPLDPCPACGAVPHDSPEGVHDVHTLRKHPHAAGTAEDGSTAAELNAGDAKWVYEHCWKCGFRPGTNVAVSLTQMQRQFAAFVKWQNDQLTQLMEERAKGIVPPSSENEMAELRRQLAEAQQNEAALRVKLGIQPDGSQNVPVEPKDDTNAE